MPSGLRVKDVRKSLFKDFSAYNIRALTHYDKEWLDFVVNCRYKRQDTTCDLIYDRMADSTGPEMSDAIEKYFIGAITVFEALTLIKDNNPNHCQYCFKTDRIIQNELIVRGKPQEVSR